MPEEIINQTNDQIDDLNASGDDLSLGEEISQSQQQQPVQQQQQPQWDGSQFQLNYRGQMVSPKSREELINLAQKGYSYSQAMEQLKRDRQQWEEERNKNKELYDKYSRFDNLLKTNPQMSQYLMQQISQYQQQRGAPQQGRQQQSYVPPELMDRLGNLETMIQRQQEQEMDKRVDQEISGLKQRYPQFAWDGENGLEQQLLQFAHANHFNSLDHAFRVMMFDQIQTQSRADGMKQVQNQRRQGIVQKGQKVAPKNNGGYKRGMDYNDLAEKMAAEMSS